MMRAVVTAPVAVDGPAGGCMVAGGGASHGATVGCVVWVVTLEDAWSAAGSAAGAGEGLLVVARVLGVAWFAFGEASSA